MSPHRVVTLPTQACLSSYDVSRNGFLPKSPPLHRLPHEYYSPWESIIAELPTLIESRLLRSRVDALPVLRTHHLIAESEWQRAYSILGCITQGYIWQGDRPSERLPPAIAVPLLEISEQLETVPVGSYPAYTLWNWTRVDDDDIRRPENLRALHTMTGTEDEDWFLMISVAMEARAGSLIRTVLSAIEAVERHDVPTVVSALEECGGEILEIARLLERMDERCDPDIFYHRIRPLLAGTMNMAAAGLPDGVFYDEGDGGGSWRKFRGGSNGQSSLVQFFDIILGVDHVGSATFHEEMRGYMPGPHARFLAGIEASASIRAFVDDNSHVGDLVTAYDFAVDGLGAFRNAHIRLVTRYIILPSRKRTQGCARNLASVSTEEVTCGRSNELVGTGGTKLVPFLRMSRDETVAARIR